MLDDGRSGPSRLSIEIGIPRPRVRDSEFTTVAAVLLFADCQQQVPVIAAVFDAVTLGRFADRGQLRFEIELAHTDGTVTIRDDAEKYSDDCQ